MPAEDVKKFLPNNNGRQMTEKQNKEDKKMINTTVL